MNFALRLCASANPKWWQSLITILWLPPGLLAVRFEGGDDVFYPVIDGVVHRVVRPSRVTVETLLLILQQDQQRLKGETVQGSVRENRGDKKKKKVALCPTHWPADDWQCSSALFSSCHMWMRPSGSSLVQPVGPLLQGNSCHGHNRGCGQAPGQQQQLGLEEANGKWLNEHERAAQSGILSK